VTLSILKNALKGVSMLALATAVGCGGGDGDGGGAGGGEGAATTAGGEVIQSATGQAVSEAAHSKWTEGVTLFNQYDAAQGDAGWSERHCDQVEELFEEANEEQNDRFAEAIYMQGLVASRCGETGDARRLFNRALELATTLCGPRVALGMMEYDSGNRAAAKTIFTAAVEAAPESCVTGYVNLAVIQSGEGPAGEQEAIDNLRRALAIQSDYMPAFNQLALVFYRQGARTNDAAKWDLAEIVCRQAQIIQGTYAPIYNTWGLIKLGRGNINEALRYFERAIQLDPRIFEAQMNFGQITFQFRGYADAERAFRTATTLRARNYEATLGLGSALRGLGRVEDAQAQYEAAIQIDANRAEAYYNLGLLYQDYKSGDPGDLNRATAYYQQFLQRAGNAAALAPTVTELGRRCQIEQQANRPGRRRRAAPTGPQRVSSRSCPADRDHARSAS
jgi:tetratricopeptide (TPR) repeat protein